MTDHAANGDSEPDSAVARLAEEIRRRRKAADLSHAQLAGQIGYSRQYISLAERARKGLPSGELINALDSALHADGALIALRQEAAAARLTRRRSRTHALVAGNLAPTINAVPRESATMLTPLRRAMLRNGDGEHTDPAARAPSGYADMKAATVRAHAHYQRADYEAASQLVVSCLNRSRIDTDAERSLNVLRIEAATYLVAAKLANKFGDVALAMLAADRALRCAQVARHPELIALANCQLACALIHARHGADAEHIAAEAVEQLARVGKGAAEHQRTEEMLSALGALWLLLAVVAGRRGDGVAAHHHLGKADQLAEQLGHDGNWLWTGFGPTNVQIHELAVLVGLGDTKRALQLDAAIDGDRLPTVLRGRRSQVHLELAEAAAGQNDDGLCILHLLEAERVATQAVTHHVQATRLLQTLLDRERQGRTPGLRALATRAGVLS